MKIQEVTKILSDMFIPRDKGLEGKCFKSEYMNKEHEAYPVQQAVSDAMRNSGLTFDFSYLIAEKACDILVEVDDWEDEDAITESVDAIMPVYTSDLMEIYASNSWAVDAAMEEMGNGKDSASNAQMAWYMQISQMVEAIKGNLSDIIEDEE